ncbi:Ppx/GppA phosphatase family protein [Candidatus Nitronereus thalassa]|uniref:Ppx/GppA phosphatase family protein n=1 Tax=Candidatus Nitronereus thalassa TaxID=3020898 RepID=A0ABU3K8D9_9BACT|nr:Ppx/GppA phosphatase family protein [Candidatus Nitronereus thalassa]MDT7042632.1 Ppx/GppA phosphatase family protein [Candidatus Nitronereus thalassa]
MRVASIDIGTLTCRLLIGDVEGPGPVKPVFSGRKILRLGEGVDETKRLKPEAMTRVVEAIKEWHGVIKQHDVGASIAVATSAVREARNREEFLRRVKQEAGIEVEVIDGQEEARRTLLGLRSGLPTSVGDILGLDIGGGSTEFIVDRQGQEVQTISIDMGVVRLSERVLKSDPPTTSEVHEAKQLIHSLTRKALGALGDTSGLTFVGTAGTITSLAAIAQGLTIYDPDRVHNYSLKLETIKNLERTILPRKQSERTGIPGLEKGREEVIAAGTLILRCVMEELDQDQCLVSEYGLREGVLVNLARQNTIY